MKTKAGTQAALAAALAGMLPTLSQSNPVLFIKVSTEYPPACWWDESGSPIGEAKVFAIKGQILV